MHRDRLQRLVTAPHLVFVALVVLGVIDIWHGASGRLVFPSDDAYINAGLGRRWFEGTALGEFPSGTTSFGWSVLFGAVASLVGDGVIAVVLVVNVIGGLWIVSLLTGLLPQRGQSVPEILFLIWSVLFLGLPLLAVLGMEHLWDAAFVIAALMAMAKLIEDGQARHGNRLALFILLAALCRQETMFLGIAIAVVLVVHRFWRHAATALAAAFLPVIVQGAVQLLQGRAFSANPIAIKASVALTPAAIPDLFATKLNYAVIPVDVALSIAATTVVLFLLLLRPATGRLAAARAVAVTSLMYIFAHLLFAQTGWLGRYQTPILACAVTVLALVFPALSLQWKTAADKLLYVPALLFALLWTAWTTQRNVVFSDLEAVSREVASQMCRIRDIASLAPKNEPVILNDVGCTTFYLDNPILDLFGLTTYEARTLGGRLGISKDNIDRLARRHGAKMAMIYKPWFENRVPDDWVEVGSWTTSTTRYAALPTVTIYATAPQWRDEVANRWRTNVRTAGQVPGVQVRD